MVEEGTAGNFQGSAVPNNPEEEQKGNGVVVVDEGEWLDTHFANQIIGKDHTSSSRYYPTIYDSDSGSEHQFD
jgi:hypothetical protein